MDHFNGFVVTSTTTKILTNFDLKKDLDDAAAGKGLSAEQVKQMQEAQAKQAKETNTVKRSTRS